MIDSDTEKIKTLWDDIQAELKTMQTYMVNLVTDFVEFFKDGKFDIQALISKILANTVDVVMDSLTNLSDLLFKAAELGISIVRALCNYEIDVPVFTWLWKSVAKGRVLTLGNFVSFLVAIPSTLLYKAVKGKAPPKLKGRVTKSTFQEYVEKGSVSQDQSLAGDISSFNICAAVGVGSILCAVTTITLVVDGVFEGAGLETYSTELHVQKLYGQSKEVPVQLFLSLPNWVGNLFDTFSLVAGSISLVCSWPLRKHISKQSTKIQLCYWGVSFFDPISFRSCSHTDHRSILGLASRGFEHGRPCGHSGDRRLRGPSPCSNQKMAWHCCCYYLHTYLSHADVVPRRRIRNQSRVHNWLRGLSSNRSCVHSACPRDDSRNALVLGVRRCSVDGRDRE